MPILEFDKVSKVYSGGRRGHFAGGRNFGTGEGSGGGSPANEIVALAETSLTIAPGDALGVIGESGAGKTTLAELAAGMIEPTSGRVLVGGGSQQPSNDRLSRARRIQLIWQDARGSIDPRLRVRQIIEEPLRVHGVSDKDARKQSGSLLEEVGLPALMAERRPHELSGGEVQRVVIARSLSLDPELLICDEPAASLDALARLRFADLLLSLQQERGLALMVIAHDLPLIRRMTTELMVMYRGEIIERGPTEGVIGSPAHEYTKLLLSSDPSLAIAAGTAKGGSSGNCSAGLSG